MARELDPRIIDDEQELLDDAYTDYDDEAPAGWWRSSDMDEQEVRY